MSALPLVTPLQRIYWKASTSGSNLEMVKRNKPKTRESVEEILDKLSERMFPDQMGHAKVTLESRASDGDSALHVLLHGNEHAPARALIEAGADVNAVGDLGYVPLHISAFKDDADMVEHLLAAGANPHVTCEVGKTPLQTAIDHGCATAARVLRRAAI